MTQLDRRRLLALGAAALTLPPAIQKAWAIDAKVTTGTIKDVDHIVILMQENRSFDHYFGTMNGVRGFGDRFPIPLPQGRTVWQQSYTKAAPSVIAPFPLNTAQTFAHMRQILNSFGGQRKIGPAKQLGANDLLQLLDPVAHGAGCDAQLLGRLGHAAQTRQRLKGQEALNRRDARCVGHG